MVTVVSEIAEIQAMTEMLVLETVESLIIETGESLIETGVSLIETGVNLKRLRARMIHMSHQNQRKKIAIEMTLATMALGETKIETETPLVIEIEMDADMMIMMTAAEILIEEIVTEEVVVITTKAIAATGIENE
mmetsp:Transcript_9423/g.16716  ORF Transcript_9423/g.16716 Transcript_9423/m.16716 type:complete len:135 (+) Transcript_9423:442-846(+)